MVELTPTVRVFKNLRGQWNIKRTLTSQPGFGLSGELTGTATFTPRKPTAHSTALELLYTEQGELKTNNGLSLRASRKYVYRYNAEEDKISVWFVKEETKDSRGQEEVDDLFLDVEVSKHEDSLVGRGEHLCSMDMYWAEFVWRPSKPDVAADEDSDDEEEEMNIWGLRYKVKGPQKDYSSDTAYERAESS